MKVDDFYEVEKEISMIALRGYRQVENLVGCP